jgi:uncharacterized protein with NRDE domain
MCLIAFAWRKHPRYRLVLAANRDEFHARPTAPAQAHEDAPRIYGGRDLLKGGSWLLVSALDRVAAVTNVRNGIEKPKPEWRSRGELVDEFAKGADGPSPWLAELSLRAPITALQPAGVGRGRAAFRQQSPALSPSPAQAGLHALSNGDLDSPWPKALRLREVLSGWIETESSMDDWPPVQKLFSALADTREARMRSCRTPASASAWSAGCPPPSSTAPTTARAPAACCCSTIARRCCTSAASAATAIPRREHPARADGAPAAPRSQP